MVIDETYNSNPTALAAVLTSLTEEEAERRIAVLGDMLELGEHAEAYHLEAGRQAAECGLDLLVGVGPLGGLIVEGARRAGADSSTLVSVDDAEQAGERVADGVRAGDVVVFKASRGVGLDRGVEVLRGRFQVESV